MTNEEIAVFLGFTPDDISNPVVANYLVALTPELRELFERMRQIELWDKGFLPKPTFPFLAD